MKKVLIICIVFAVLITAYSASKSSVLAEQEKGGRVYECDYKTLSVNTEIQTLYKGEEISISGNILRFIEDPLTAKTQSGKILGYAGDAYGLIEQDDHGIYVDGKFELNMNGKFMLLGNSYQLKDAKGNVVAKAEFDPFSVSGKIVDANENIIAIYSSGVMLNDYKVIIYDNDVCSDLAILMIMASYVSDAKFDEN